MRALMTHLVQVHGFRRLAFIQGPAGNPESETRLRVFREVLGEHRVPWDRAQIVTGDFLTPSGVEAIRVLLDERRLSLDAVVAASDAMAIGAMDALMARGLRVPQDIAVVGFDDVELAQFTTAPLTTVRQPLFDLGVQAIDLVLAQLRGEPSRSRVVLRTQLVTRQSCGCSPVTGLPFAHYDSPRNTGTVATTLQSERAVVLSNLARAMRALSASIDASWAERLLDALDTELHGDAPGLVTSTLHELLLLVAALNGNVSAWQAVISVLRYHLAPCATSDFAIWSRSEDLWNDARTLIAGVAERSQAQLHLRRTQTERQLRCMAVEMAATVDAQGLSDVLARHLPNLRIRSFFLVTLEGSEAASGLGRLVGAQDAERQAASYSRDGLFPVRQLVPPGTLPARRYSYVIEPIGFDETAIGYVLMELGRVDGPVFESIRTQLCAGFRTGSLFRELIEETAVRQIAEKERLEKEVELALELRSSALPRIRHIPGLRVAAGLRAAGEMGAEFYDVHPVEDGAWFIIGGVKGEKASRDVLILHAIFAALAHSCPKASPRAVLERAEEAFAETLGPRFGTTRRPRLSVIRYEQTGRISAYGSHMELFLRHGADGQTTPILSANTVANAVEECILLTEGDLLVLCSEGLIQTRNDDDVPLGVDRLFRTIDKVCFAPVEEARDRILETARSWSAMQAEDYAVVVAGYAGSAAPTSKEKAGD
jgi:hypothetical protein